jgi:hypothetical protein
MQRLALLVSVLSIWCSWAVSQNTPATASPGNVAASQMAGRDAGEKISAAIGQLPSSGGTVDARGLTGPQQITSDIFEGKAKSVQILLGHAVYTCTKVGSDYCIRIPSNTSLVGCGKGCSVLRQGNHIGSWVRTVKLAKNARNIEITGIEFDGNRENNADKVVQNHAIITDSNDNVNIHNNYFHDQNGDGVIFTSGGISPQSYEILSAVGNGAVSTITTAAGSFQTGEAVCLLMTQSALDGCYTITSVTHAGVRQPTQINVRASFKGEISKAGLVTPQNYMNELGPAGGNSIKQFHYQLQHPQVVPGSLVITVGESKYVDNRLGAISGPGMKLSSIDYATGTVALYFQTPTPQGMQITTSYAGGSQGFTSNFDFNDNLTENMGRAHVAIISARQGRINRNTMKTDVDFGEIHWEPDSSYQEARNIEVADNILYSPGISSTLTVGTQTHAGDQCSNVNVHDNTLIGGSIILARCPHTSLRGNQIYNSASEQPIAAAGRDYNISDNWISGLMPGLTVDRDAAGISYNSISQNDTAGAAAGTGNSTICQNHVYDVMGNGILIQASSDNIICNNEIRDIRAVYPGNANYANGIQIAGHLDIKANDNIVMGNRINDDQITRTMQRGLIVNAGAIDTVVSTNISTNAAYQNYSDAGSGTVWRTNLGKSDNAQSPSIKQ